MFLSLNWKLDMSIQMVWDLSRLIYGCIETAYEA